MGSIMIKSTDIKDILMSHIESKEKCYHKLYINHHKQISNT